MQTNYGTTTSTKPSPIFYGIVVVTAIGAWLTTVDFVDHGIGVFIFVIAGWILSLTVHEFAHAFVAWRSGDDSVVQRGYLTLDPRRYTNPLLSIVLPVFFIAMGGFALPGGAVLINHAKLNDRQATKVALAGPLTNLAFAVVTLSLVGFGLVDLARFPDLVAALAVFGYFEAFVFIINMLPIPGLDGYAALEPSLPESVQELMRPIRQFGFMILIFILIYDNPIGNAISDGVIMIVNAFGVDTFEIGVGLRLLRFWS